MNAFGPYSPIVKTGNMFFVSGQVGVNPKTGRSAKSISEQTKQLFENLYVAGQLLASDFPFPEDLPLGFEVNVGQASEDVDYQARGNGYQVGLTATQALLALSTEGPSTDIDPPQ